MSTATPRQIGAELFARLATIKTDNGFSTNIGTTVFRGKKSLDESDAPCAVLVEGPDHPKEQNRKSVHLTQTYFLEAHDACDPDHPNDKAHDIIDDLMRAVFPESEAASGLYTLGGLVRKVEYKGRTIGAREDGAAMVFAGIQIDVDFAQACGGN